MIAYLLKNWKLLLDLVLVVGGIILLAIVDPFEMFSKAKLRGTANLISSVKDIGELVTAEYYGEVISSLHETIIYNEQPKELTTNYEGFYYGLKELIVDESLIDENKKLRKILRQLPGQVSSSKGLEELSQDFAVNSTYQQGFAFLGWKMMGGDWDRYVKNKELVNDTTLKVTLKNAAVRVVVEKLVAEYEQFLKSEKTDARSLSSDQIQKYIYQSSLGYVNEFPNYHYQLVSDLRLQKKKTRKKDIVFIGRGWVKAGFKFDRLDDTNFFYNEDSKTIHLYGLYPVVLDKDINPWFIPEEKVKGFELIDSYGNASFEEAKLVKVKCKEKLLEQAENADILEQARANGQVALESFFSLVLDEPDLKVTIKDFPNESLIKWIIADTLVTVNEALIIDSIFQEVKADTLKPAAEIYEGREEFKLMMNKLMACDFVSKGTPFNYLSMQIAQYLERKLYLVAGDYEDLKSVRGTLYKIKENGEETLTTDSMIAHGFYDDYNSYTRDFNLMLRLMDEQLDLVKDLRNDTLLIEKERYDKYKLNNATNVVDTMQSINENTVYAITLNPSDLSSFWNLHFPIMTLKPSDFQGLGIGDTTRNQLGPIFYRYKEEVLKEKSRDPEIQTLFIKETDLLADFKADSVKGAIRLRPVRSYIKKVKKFLSN